MIREATKRAYANKTKESITCHTLGCHNFWQIAISTLNKIKSNISSPLKEVMPRC